MASVPPDPASADRDRRRREAEAAALALLLRAPKPRYDLPALVRQHGIKPRPFRQIAPTMALKANMAAPHRAVVEAWQAQADGIVAAHQRSPEDGRRQLAFATAAVGGYLATAKKQVPVAAQRVETWHRAQWVARVKAATGLDVAMLTAAADVQAEVRGAVAWSEALTEDVSQQVRHRIATALLGGGDAADVAKLIREAVAKARRRAAAIGDDQADKLSRAMDRSRRAAAGVSTYRWHHTPQRHPRNWHLARDGKTFGPGDIPDDDAAGVLPFCKCWEEPLL